MHCLTMERAHSTWNGRALGPLAPPTITNSNVEMQVVHSGIESDARFIASSIAQH